MLSFEITSCYKLATKPEVKLSTGCKVLNDFFRGGLLPRRVYEVYGESGTGKTQFAIQLLLNAVLPEKLGGLEGSALFVMAAKIVNEKRFSEMKEAFLQGHGTSIDEHTLSTRIQLQQAQNLDDYYKIFLNLASRIDRE